MSPACSARRFSATARPLLHLRFLPATCWRGWKVVSPKWPDPRTQARRCAPGTRPLPGLSALLPHAPGHLLDFSQRVLPVLGGLDQRDEGLRAETRAQSGLQPRDLPPGFPAPCVQTLDPAEGRATLGRQPPVSVRGGPRRELEEGLRPLFLLEHLEAVQPAAQQTLEQAQDEGGRAVRRRPHALAAPHRGRIHHELEEQRPAHPAAGRCAGIVRATPCWRACRSAPGRGARA